jgi:hypothetical protein
MIRATENHTGKPPRGLYRCLQRPHCQAQPGRLSVPVGLRDWIVIALLRGRSNAFRIARSYVVHTTPTFFL